MTLHELIYSDATKITEEHVIYILYNILCAMKFLHSTNIMHRNLSLKDILVDEECKVNICGFSKARQVPEDCDMQKNT